MTEQSSTPTCGTPGHVMCALCGAKRHPVVTDVWVKIEVDPDTGRITARCGLDREAQYAMTTGSQDYWSALYSLTPYIANLCSGDPFGMLPHG